MKKEGSEAKRRLGGLAGWVLEKLHRGAIAERHLTLVERIALAPKGIADGTHERPGDGENQTLPPAVPAAKPDTGKDLAPGANLLVDVELEATLRFGCREMPLGDVLDLGPGDVVELDRQVNDPVDLIVGDKVVARGEVVLVNGNFGLRVTEVAEPRKRLESIRCLF